MKLQTIKQDIPKQENNVQSDPQKVAYFVLEFKSLPDIPVIILIDLSYLNETKFKYPEGAHWSISALEQFIKNKNNHDQNLFRAINLVKSVLGGRIVK